MSRFDTARRGRILAWTGAALALGTAVTIAWLEPANAEATSPTVTTPSTSAVATASQIAAMPNLPVQGLVILRYQPSGGAHPKCAPSTSSRRSPRPSVGHLRNQLRHRHNGAAVHDPHRVPGDGHHHSGLVSGRPIPGCTSGSSTSKRRVVAFGLKVT